jgi:PHP family Zn ribbon phosphoesterase
MTQPITPSETLQSALNLPYGARFYRCALQINPYAYLQEFRGNEGSIFTDEDDYNRAMITAFKEKEITVISVTDHYRVDNSQKLVQAAQQAGILVFPGFEAVTKEGIHILCLFPLDKSRDEMIGILGECGVSVGISGSPPGNKDAIELLECIRKHGGICIAAHILSSGGLFKVLNGQPRANVWKSPDLLACSIAGSVEDTPQGEREILKNKNPVYKREKNREVAVLNAQDVTKPDDLDKQGGSCWIKMSDVSIEGLRQAFLDPKSRIRLQSDPSPGDHAQFVSLSWQGGDFHFHDKTAIHFNPDLNVLVGGRGTGKSTIVESLRYVLNLEPLGDEARKAHEGVIKHVLKSGTKISLLVRAHRPLLGAPHHYTIERTIPSPPVVKDEKGDILDLQPVDIIPQAEVFGQHEISELTKDKAKLTRLIEKFVPLDGKRAQRKLELTQALEKSRLRILENKRDIKSIEDRLLALPALEETLKRYQSAGLEERLKEKSQLVREEQIFTLIQERLQPFKEFEENLRQGLPIDVAFLSEKALDNLPGAAILTEAQPVFDELNQKLISLVGQMAVILNMAQDGFKAVRAKWDIRKVEANQNYETILRELQQSKVDGEEFIRLRKQIEELRPQKERLDILTRNLKESESQRRKLLDEWENLKRSEFEQINKAATNVSSELGGRVRVRVTHAGDINPLINILREVLGGTVMNQANRDKLLSLETLSVPAFSQACREGKSILNRQFNLTPGASEKIIEGGEPLFMQIEELELAPTTSIELNVSAEGQEPEWKLLEDLSTGQKATAVLLLLLLDSDAPLVVDQPEDDLDNRFITDGVVPIMRDKKRQRQFIFSTHNANIPVLGDAELILGLQVRDRKGEIPEKHMGAIDAKPVQHLVGEILEGGQAAFELRRLKYGY